MPVSDSSLLAGTGAVAFRWVQADGWPIDSVSDNVAAWGYSPIELIGRHFVELMHPEDLARIEREVVPHIANSERWQLEYRIADGSGWRWVEDHTWVERDASGEARFFNGVLFDVTERKLADIGLHAAACAVPVMLGSAPLPERMQSVLQEVGQRLGLDRAFVFEFIEDSPHGALTVKRAVWRRPGLWELLHNAPLDREHIEPDYSGWLARLRNGECIAGPTDAFPAQEQSLLRRQHIRSLMIVPILQRGRLWGILGFDDVSQARPWRASDERVLRLIAAAFAAAMDRQLAEDELRESEARYRLALDGANAGAWEWRPGRPNVWSEGYYRILGLPASAAATFDNWLARVHPDDRERVIAAVAKARQDRAPLNMEYRVVASTGVRWISSIGRPLPGSDDSDAGMAGIVLDITEQRRHQAELNRLAHVDALTGLPNRLRAQQLLQTAIAEVELTDSRLALLLLDIDRFKTINDSLGHQAGDELLRAIGTRLRGATAVADTVARTGGDEFLIVARGATSARDAATFAENLLTAFVASFRLSGGFEVFVRTSIGISMFPEDGSSATELLRNADAALYRAKDLGRNSYQFFAPALLDAATRRLAIEGQLRQALERDEFLVHYQPIFNCDTDAIDAVEALVRWRPAGGELVMPGEFIDIAEDTGLIESLGEFVLLTACRQVQRWRRARAPELRLCVNVSARQLRAADFTDRMLRVLGETGLDPDALELELTESLLIEHGRHLQRVLTGLRKLGMRIAIDDFGTGYSSLSYLKHLPVDTLKIDRSFVKDIDADDGAAITGAVIALGQQLNLDLLAEGVETQAQLEFLRARGCQYYQGLLRSPALAPEVLAQTYGLT